MLLESCARDAGLTPRGAKAMRTMLRGALTARLCSEAAWQANPGYAQVPIDRPIFVTGLPRTGTTALHRLLAADPAHQGLAMWLAEVPQPRPPRETWPANPVFGYIQAACERHHTEHPEFMAVHYVAADQVEECWQLLRQSMRSDLLGVPRASARVLGLAGAAGLDRCVPAAPAQPAADRPAGGLPLLGAEEPQSPVHARRAAGGLPGRAGHPDPSRPWHGDRIGLQPGRPGVGRWSTTFTGAVIGRDQLELWASGLERFTAMRARHDPDQFFDVSYDDLAADPVGTVEAVYAYFGLPFSGAAAGAMRAYLTRSADRSRSAHRYALADFGLTAADVGARFGGLSPSAAELR